MTVGNDVPVTTRRLWRFRLAALAISTIVSLGVLGVYLVMRNRPIYLQEPGHHRTGHRYLYDPHLGWRNIPNWRATTNGRTLTINSKGLRDREYPYKKPAGVRRILVLGDSFAWGYGVADDEIFTEVLERRLTEDGSRQQAEHEVINTGVSGWGTDQEYLFLQREGFKYEPDVVVLAFFVVNDIEDSAASRTYGMQKPVFLNANLDLANVPVPKPSVEARVIRTQIAKLDLTLAIVRRMRDECSARGCRLIIVKFGRYIPHWKNNADLLANERRLKDEARRLKIPYMDLDDAFDARGATAEELLDGNDDSHWNGYGHWLAADLLHRFLLESRLLGD